MNLIKTFILNYIIICVCTKVVSLMSRKKMCTSTFSTNYNYNNNNSKVNRQPLNDDETTNFFLWQVNIK